MKLKLLPVLLLFMVMGCMQGLAQTVVDPKNPKNLGIRNVYWVEAGFGMSNLGWISSYSINLETVKNIMVVAGISNLSKGGLSPEQSFYERESWYAGLGLINKKGASLKMVSISASFSDFEHNIFEGQYTDAGVPMHQIKTSEAIGVRIEGKIVPNNGWAGFAVSPFVDINGSKSMVGASMAIALGRMW
ncbi:hypothetical protein ACFCT7_04150 [Fulvivirgaceae bacterium LMO-SS25]